MKPKAVTIIAEIGQNHGGNMQLARKLIRLAKENGADLAKFQLYSTGGLERSPDVLEILKQGELSFDQAKMLFDYGKEVGIEVFFSVFDVERVRWCEKIGVCQYKFAATLNNQEVIRNVMATNKPIISSRQYKTPFYPMKMLLCVSKYPATLADYKLSENNFSGFYDGISDHTIGIDLARIALARGCKILEKHFAVTHKTGADAEYSMTPQELKELRGFAGLCRGLIDE